MYIDLNKGKEISMGVSLKDSLRLNKGIKRELLIYLGISNLLFLESKTLGELVEWLTREQYISGVKYSLSEVYSYLWQKGYRIDISLIKTEGFTKEITTEDDYILELIEGIGSVNVYRLSFKYNKLLELERQLLRKNPRQQSKYKIVNFFRLRNELKKLENLDRYSDIVEWYLLEDVEQTGVKINAKEVIEGLVDL